MSKNTEVALIETGLADMDKVTAGIAALAAKYKGVVYDCRKPADMTAAREARRAIKDPRVEVEKIRKAAKAPILEIGRKLDAEAARITAELAALENPIDAQIKAEENRLEAERLAKVKAEQERVATIQLRITVMEDLTRRAVLFKTAADIEGAIELVRRVEIDASFAEFQGAATMAKEDALRRLIELHVAAKGREAESARLAAERVELDKKRAEQAERERRARDIQDRLAELRGCETLTSMSGVDLIAEHITDLTALSTDDAVFGEFAQQARDTKASGMARLNALLTAAVDYETEQARLKQERERQAAEAERIRKEGEELAARQREEQERKDREEQARRDEEARQTRERDQREANEAAERARQERHDFVPELEAVVHVLSTTYGQTHERVMEWLPKLVKGNGKARKAA